MTSDEPTQCGRSNAITSTAGNAERSATMPAVARAVAVPDEERVVVEPDRVSSLDSRGSVHPRGDRDPSRLEALADASRLSPASLLSWPQQGCPIVADEHRVVDVDRVGIARVVPGDDHLGAGGGEHGTKRLVLGDGDGRIGDTAPAVTLDVTGVGREGRPHEHPHEFAPHRLTAVAGHEAEARRQRWPARDPRAGRP